jgi:CRP-like cAMP-binding protein
MASAVRASARAREGSRDHKDLERAEQNRLLKALPAETYERLLPHLEPVQLATRQILWEPDAPIRSVYFPRSCVISLIILLDGEPSVEAATVGREGLLGVPVALGAEATSALALAQVPGEGVRLPASTFREALAGDGALASLVLRYAQVLLEQTSQSVACNRRHTLDERCARWLLMTCDRVGADQFPLTQEFLAVMLGVRRAGVTVAAGILQQAGLIRYSRGKITILDRARLEDASCECYRIVRETSDRLLGAPAA